VKSIGVRQKRHGRSEIERGTVEIEAVAERQHHGDDALRHAHTLQLFDMRGDRHLRRPGGKGKQHRTHHLSRHRERPLAYKPHDPEKQDGHDDIAQGGFASWAFVTDQPRRDLHGKMDMLNA
jgi:hypothetical protein